MGGVNRHFRESFVSTDDDGALGVMQNVVADAGASKCPLELAETT